MFTFETADQKEVRRFRIAQFNGRTATVESGGSTVTGHVRSVLESKSSIPPRWTITIVPSAAETACLAVDHAPRSYLRGRLLLSGTPSGRRVCFQSPATLRSVKIEAASD